MPVPSRTEIFATTPKSTLRIFSDLKAPSFSPTISPTSHQPGRIRGNQTPYERKYDPPIYPMQALAAAKWLRRRHLLFIFRLAMFNIAHPLTRKVHG